jgi:hypothetical protein
MNEQKTGDLHALVEEKLSADTDFNASLEGMSDEEKAQAISSKRTELINAEYNRVIEYGGNMKARAEKAEGKKKPNEEKPEETPKKPDTDEYQLTYKDNYALTQQQVHVDDVDEVVRYAKFSNLTVAEALADTTLQAILTRRTEERSSSKAMNKGGGKASIKKATPAQVLKDASEGKMPEPGSPEAQALFDARRGR